MASSRGISRWPNPPDQNYGKSTGPPASGTRLRRIKEDRKRAQYKGVLPEHQLWGEDDHYFISVSQPKT